MISFSEDWVKTRRVVFGKQVAPLLPLRLLAFVLWTAHHLSNSQKSVELRPWGQFPSNSIKTNQAAEVLKRIMSNVSATCLKPELIMNAALGFKLMWEIRVKLGGLRWIPICVFCKNEAWLLRLTESHSVLLFHTTSCPLGQIFAVAGTSKWFFPTSPGAKNKWSFFHLSSHFSHL